MKHILLLCAGLIISIYVSAQVMNFDEIQPTEVYENVHVQKIYSDSAVSTFIIWVKQEVPAHYHAHHTEQVYVIEGKGIMTIDGEEWLVKTGDYIYLPEGAIHAVTVTSEIPLKVLSIQAPEFDGADRVWVEE